MKSNKTIHKIGDYLVYLFVRVIICTVQSLSLEFCDYASWYLALFFTDFLGVRRKVLKKNLEAAYPEMSVRERRQLIRKMWHHLFLMVSEVALAPRLMNELNWWKQVRLIDPYPMVEMVHSDRPLILVTGHFGNFEMGGYILGLLGYPTYSVARTLDNRYLNHFIEGFRESTGQFLISKNEGYDEILDVLRAGETLAFLADQSAGPKGCWVQFFNRPASAYKAMALLSLEYDAPILVCHATRYQNKPLNIHLKNVAIFDPRNHPEELSSIKQITQWFTSHLEAGIRELPEQYWWMHNRWKTYGKTFRPDK